MDSSNTGPNPYTTTSIWGNRAEPPWWTEETEDIRDHPNFAPHLASVIVQLQRFNFDLTDPDIGQRAISEVRRLLTVRVETRHQAALRELAEERALQAVSDGIHFVYYLDLYGAVIKIGTSRTVLTRVRQLRRGIHDLLAVEPGSYEVEKARHLQFSRERHRGTEDFDRSPELLAHIDRIVQQHGDPVQALLGGAAA